MRTQLRNIVFLLLAIGTVFTAYPFIKFMGLNEKNENDAILKINISNMTVGEVIHIENAYYLYKENEKEYRLMNGWAPFRGCPIYYVSAGVAKYSQNNRQKFNEIPHFLDKCDGTLWELSGKLVRETAYYKERDMRQRKYKIIDDYVLFHNSKS